MQNETNIILAIYRGFLSLDKGDGIPVRLRPSHVVGTVQDDPFDCWVEEIIKNVLPKDFDVYHSGQLTTPDLVIRDKNTGTIIGLEIKKLIQTTNGRDSRGLTLDYNSTLPCGKTFIKVGGETCIVPCYYLFAMLSPRSDRVVTLILLNGDFINYDFDLYKEAKYANYSEYDHGPYGEGSVRHRRMYTYPNPLNSRLACFHRRQVLVLKKRDVERRPEGINAQELIVRRDKYGNDFYYCLIDETASAPVQGALPVLEDLFAECKKRKRKERVAYIPEIPKD